MTEAGKQHPAPDGGRGGGAMWGGRFEGGPAALFRALNDSLPFDRRLLAQDLQGSAAWARALAGAGILTTEESRQIVEELNRIGAEAARGGRQPQPGEAEDIHTWVEQRLIAALGPLGKKLHTGRSRNDQVATDLRLWTLDAVADLDRALVELGRALVGLAEQGLAIVMPGYTHLQQGQPIRAAHWALAPVWALLRDRERLRAVARSAAILPLGSGAVAGCPFPVDRDALARDLGFRTISANSLDAISDRDFLAELLFAGAMIGVHLSRIAEDLVLFSSAEFAFVRLSDGYSTGSSLMPQKRNPDVAELVRGKSGRLFGNLVGLLTLLKGLPTGYNRDLQEDKALVFDTVDTLALVLPALAGAVATARFRPEQIRRRLDAQLWATDLADYLVRRGVPFRHSHEAIGRIVRLTEERGVALTDLTLGDYRTVHPAFEADVHDLFDWDRSADSRAVPGGTARSAVEEQLAAARAALAE